MRRQEVAAGRTASLGGEHPDTLATKGKIAAILAQTGEGRDSRCCRIC